MEKIIECVPNFSEGRDKKKIDRIVREIKKEKDVRVLDVSMDADYNRSVISFAGPPEAVLWAGFRAIFEAENLINMSQHKGEHPRIGACDVFPFVPISGVTMEECIILAKRLGRILGDILYDTVYLYGEAAAFPERIDLAEIRRGGYERLEEKLKDPLWKPDYGPADFNRRSGAVIVGARKPLIAFNINLETENEKAASIIAKVIRQKHLKAIGVFLKERGIYQVSANLTDYRIIPPHEVFETVKRLSPGLAKVVGSEIVGLVPKEAILMAGRHYLPEEKSEEKLIRAAIKNLGLNSLKKFNPKKKIIEFLI